CGNELPHYQRHPVRSAAIHRRVGSKCGNELPHYQLRPTRPAWSLPMAAARPNFWFYPASLGALGFLLGTMGGGCQLLTTTRTAAHEYPLPHHIPKHPGNLTLRFAMVHDVIHERFPRHGPDYYRARNREVDAALPKTILPTQKGKFTDDYFALLDDKGVG